MSDDWTTERWETAIRAVFRRALADPAFRALARIDPQAAFAQANGCPAPSGVKFRFAEALDEHVYVLPKLVQPFGSLSEIDVSRILHHAMRQQSVPPTFSAS
jgi:hypothetical protein